MATLTGSGRSTTTVGSQTVVIGKATPSVVWKAKSGRRSGSKRKVTFSIAVTAPGVAPLSGKVTIRDGRKVVKTLTLVKGKRSYTAKLSAVVTRSRSRTPGRRGWPARRP
ncbi:hypothetical protein [Aeromicrobium sp. UC242_57]|uniref:hypothetical protein n=1 Tax=Aeromicrobium sp. UC242_57 TaxID=3374624 RepID=UPI0037AC4593